MNNLTTVDFHGDVLFAAEQDGDIFVAVKPICESLGLDWKSQYRRLSADQILCEGMVMMTIPSAGGMQETTLLRLDLVNGFLFGIDENRVAPEAREKVLRYKRECYQVLYRHFSGQSQARYQDPLDDPQQRAKFAAMERKAIEGYIAAHHLTLKLSAQMLSLGEPSQRFLTYQVLKKVCDEMGVDCPPMETMGQDRPEVPDVLLNFWEAFEDLPNRDQMNHSADSGEIAINLPQLREHMSKLDPRIQIDVVLKQALRGSRRPYPQFVETKPVRSVHTKEPIRCWVFKV